MRDVVAGKNAAYGHTETRECLADEKSGSQGLAEREMRKVRQDRTVDNIRQRC